MVFDVRRENCVPGMPLAAFSASGSKLLPGADEASRHADRGPSADSSHGLPAQGLEKVPGGVSLAGSRGVTAVCLLCLGNPWLRAPICTATGS